MLFTRNEKFWGVGCGIINLPMLPRIEVETKNNNIYDNKHISLGGKTELGSNLQFT